ncbi:sodium:proton antiporter, partial [Staphylococcus aureus]|nr:sodium:proton antiporter [Staphylococcus aureus]
ISEHNILEIPAKKQNQLTKNDMVLYHIDNNSVVTFKRSNQFISEAEEGVIGYLKDAYLHQNI